MLMVRPRLPEDAASLAPRLRTEDLLEIKAATGEEPLAALERCSVASDPCFAITAGEQLIALFGVVPDGPDRGIVWLVGSDEIARRPFRFARASRYWVERLHERYRVLWNLADARNETHLRWIRFCGFTIHRRVEQHGTGRKPFYEFSRTQPKRGPRGAEE
ncbi:hypothetical protein F0U62_21075 [Cystobacter fuscus]|uniref:hypothetical protein n=1 Tax=Cystobacter fuscus TaxID=43 RepID=UPI002B2E774A|nr:hypothetical protein F0U62_21075 [Cystobacter fuscus]